MFNLQRASGAEIGNRTISFKIIRNHLLDYMFNSKAIKNIRLNKSWPLLSAFFVTGAVLSGCDQQPDRNLINNIEISNSANEVIEIGTNNSQQITEPEVDDNRGHITSVSLPISCRNDIITKAYQQKKSSLQVKGCGRVQAILSDDNKGSRHQRFIVQLEDTEPHQTILIAHNIDLAPRVKDLQTNDEVLFYGEYEYNTQGGVVHWTHKDPTARHQHGWIKHNDITYD